MHQRRLARLLLRPSLFSIVATTFLAVVILGVSIWPYTAESPLLSQYIYGPHGVMAAIRQSPDIANFTAAFSVSPLVYNILILVVAALVASGVYVVLQLISKIIVGSYDTWHAIHDAGSAAHDVEKEIGTRLTIRLMSLLLWLTYIFFFWSLLVPYSVYITRAGIDELLNWGAADVIIGFIILLATMHVHIIFLRLLVLRPRVFGGKLDILEAMYDAENEQRATIERQAIPRELD